MKIKRLNIKATEKQHADIKAKAARFRITIQTYAINAMLHFEPQYTNQTKTRLGSNEQ